MLAGYIDNDNSSASNVGEGRVNAIETGGRGTSGTYDPPEGQASFMDGAGPLRTGRPRSPGDKGRAGGGKLVSIRGSG